MRSATIGDPDHAGNGSGVSHMKVSVILPAAGLGTRMGRPPSPERVGTSRKQFMLLSGLPILVHTVRKFVAAPSVAEIVIALRADDLAWVRELVEPDSRVKPVRLVEGGENRQHSVENALATVDPDVELIAVHDAVRPFVDVGTIEKVIAAASES